ncbi:MAG: amidase family protein [Desulfosalsimonadaceae bacterium]
MESIFVYRDPDPAGSSSDSGPLTGLNIAIQPNVSVAGWPTEAGSRALENFTALEDATIIGRLREAGAALCGSTRMSEFGFGLDGSRAGAALKENAADAEIVLDLMGESRIAAGHADVCGFKPSYGLVSVLGLVGLIPSMECWGLLSANISRIREILDTIAGPDPLDFSLPDDPAPDFFAREVVPENTRIGIVSEAADELPAEGKSAFDGSVNELKKAGFLVRELSFADMALFSLVHSIVGSVEASSSAGRYDSVRYGRREPGAKNWNEMYLRSRGAAFGTLVKSYLFQGAYFQFERYAAYEDACRIRARLVADMEKLFDQADFLVFPAAGGSGKESSLAGTYEQFSATLFANVTGQPVLYLPPAPGSKAGGFQLAGPRLSDAGVLALGGHFLNLRQGGCL